MLTIEARAALIFFASLAVALFVLPRLGNIASRIGLMDYPAKRKVHRTPRPLVGGIGMVMAISLSALLFISLKNLRGFYAGVIVLVVVGFLDDFRELSHRWKFVAQVLASVFMLRFSKTVLMTFGDLLSLGPMDLGMLAIPATVFCTVGVINAINMLDGLDGLAGGVSAMALASFAFLSYINNQTELMLLSIALGGAAIGFLRYNWPPSRLFMGDAGSLFLGFSLAFLSIAVTQKAQSGVPPMAALLILSVPIVDTVTVMTRRIMRGKSPFYAEKNHIHHILLRFGADEKAAVAIILSLSAAFCLAAITGTVLHIPDYYLFLIFSIYFALYFTGSFYLKKILRFWLRYKRERNAGAEKSS